MSAYGMPPDRLSPTTPARIMPVDTRFTAGTASPGNTMPTAGAPAAPIPVHTAQAGPASSSRNAAVSRPMLISAEAAKLVVGHG